MAKGTSSKAKQSSSSKTKIPISIQKSSSSSKNKNKNKNTNTNNKKKPTKLAKEEIQSLPPNWPVSSEPSTLSSQQILNPGNILHKCSGRDIKLSKNSDTRPNLAAGRGRFLFVLPGLLSFKKPAVEKPQEKETSPYITCTTDDQDMEMNANANKSTNTSTNKNTPSDDAKVGAAKAPVPPGSSTSTTGKNASNASTLLTMGKVKNLDTDHPSLEVKLPNGQLLVFKGKKVSTTSRYLVLSCKTSGVVNCRNIFQEMIVFGNHSLTPLEAGKEDEKKEDEVCVERTLEEQEGEGEQKQERSFYHYGGSERALDGGREVRGVKRSTRLSSGTVGSCVKTDLALSQESKASQEHADVHAKKDAKDGSDSDGPDQSAVIELDSDDSGEGEFKTDSPAPPPRAKSSRRSASKKLQYTFADNNSDSEQEPGSDAASTSSSINEAPPTRVNSSRRSSSKQVKYTVDDSDSNSSMGDAEEEDLDEEVKEVKTARKPRSGTMKTVVDLTGKKDDKKKKRPVASNAKGKTPTSETKNSALEESNSTDAKKSSSKKKDVLTTPSPSLRKRRKDTSPKKSTSSSKALDIGMDDDDEFIFIE